jgi:UDP-N-acetyl-2-amino-2-deoxyglucuronate dehydrogenase
VKQVNVGIIGAGWCGGIRAIAAANSPLVSSLHIAEINESRLAEIKAKTNPTTAVTGWEQIVANPAVDAVMVSTTPETTHYPITRAALMAGKHVLLEKPIEITTERSLEIVRLCRAANLKLGIVLQHRFRPPAKQLRSRIEAGDLGRILAASAGIRLWRPQAYYDEPGRGTLARDGGGVLLTQGIHTLDLLLSLVGPAAEVASYVTTTPLHRMETEDLVVAALRYRNGALGTVEATTAAFPGHPERIEIIGEKGTAAIEGPALKVLLADGRKMEIASDDRAGGTGADPMAFPHVWHRELITDFLDAIETGGEPLVTGEEALAVHFLIDALLESGRTGTPATVRAGG